MMSTAAHSQPSLLAFDTSTETTAVALVCAAGVFTHEGPGGAQASAALLPQVHALLRAAGVGLQQLQAIAFGQGPGAFTGLRTSCAVAQGLAFGLGCPVLPLDSLQLVAEDALAQAVDGSGVQPEGLELAVAMDARMDEAYAARYRRSGGTWQVLHAPALYMLPALAQHWNAQPPAWVAGSAVTAFAGRLPLPPAAQCVPVERSRAAALARLAVAAWHAHGAIDPGLALPTYLRDKVALTTAERQAVRDAAAPTGAVRP